MILVNENIEIEKYVIGKKFLIKSFNFSIFCGKKRKVLLVFEILKVEEILGKGLGKKWKIKEEVVKEKNFLLGKKDVR